MHTYLSCWRVAGAVRHAAIPTLQGQRHVWIPDLLTFFRPLLLSSKWIDRQRKEGERARSAGERENVCQKRAALYPAAGVLCPVPCHRINCPSLAGRSNPRLHLHVRTEVGVSNKFAMLGDTRAWDGMQLATESQCRYAHIGSN